MTTTREFIEQVKEYHLMNEGPLRNVGDDVEMLVKLVETYERALVECAAGEPCYEYVADKALADAQKVVEGK